VEPERRHREEQHSTVRKADNLDQLTRNTYKVLLTHGLQGCAIGSGDPDTRQMLAGLGTAGLGARP
jgi:DUF2075 family protein